MDDEVPQRYLEALAHGSRGPGRLTANILTRIDSAFHKDRNEIQERFETGRITALFAAKALSNLHDLLIQVLCDFVTEHLYRAPNPTEAEHIAIVATGGYGRRQLAPQSDIDLLFLRPYKQTSWTESVIEFVLHKLWDMGLKVGHATRSIDECIRLAGNDITVRTALLDARFVWGDAALADQLRRDFRTKVAAVTGLYFVSAKLAERDERHIRQGASRYLVEPNIKEGKGGLRDLHTLYWVGKYLYAVDDAAALIHHNVFTREEFGAFQEAEGFLWSVRFHLHYVAHRPGDRLTFDVQPEIARQCGFGDKNVRRASRPSCSVIFLLRRMLVS